VVAIGVRRPQWRGERQAVMVRLPVEEADRLRLAARRRGRSISDTAADLIIDGLERGDTE
jgi:hypothetical protein